MVPSGDMEDARIEQNRWFSRQYYTSAMIVIWVMLVAYSLPVFAMILCAMLTRGFTEQHFILKMFSTLVQTGDDSYSIFHRVLVPLVSGFSVIAFRDRATSRNALSLVVFILATVLSALGLNLYISSAKLDLEGLQSAAFSFDVSLAKTFLNRIQEVLSTLMMMLLGLQLSDSLTIKKEKQ